MVGWETIVIETTCCVHCYSLPSYVALSILYYNPCVVFCVICVCGQCCVITLLTGVSIGSELPQYCKYETVVCHIKYISLVNVIVGINK